ncbi:MAG: DUF1214 domain-containing protein [Porticoccaceae bacterium]|nr:DUF1214 domain-containing protein [Pseudomonadales bacterium]MCP5171717.1 DUF1214 domain-containing protein [Pseudomonadales bacterium]
MTTLSLADWQGKSLPGLDSPAIWQAFSSAVEDLQKLVWDDPQINDDMARAEGVRYLSRLLAGAIPMTLEGWDPDYPSLLTFLSSRIQYGLPAADALYQWAPIHGDHVYHIKGLRGSAYMMDIETRVGHFAHVNNWQVVDRSSELKANADGTIDIVLSRDERPGNWVKIADGPGDLILRQYFYDWLSEDVAQLQISREGAIYPPPALTPETISKRTQLLIDWLQILPPFFAEQVKRYYEIPTNTMVFDEVSIGWAELRYGKSNYECGPDEALIVEVKPPNAQYWSMQLYSQYWDARDWNLRQTSINGFQAVLNEDGIFRAVISHVDPGIQNWLDAGGHQTGLISVRYFRADEINVPAIKRVKLAEIKHYFNDEERCISPQSRSEYLQARAESVIRRGCL